MNSSNPAGEFSTIFTSSLGVGPETSTSDPVPAHLFYLGRVAMFFIVTAMLAAFAGILKHIFGGES